jgi:light-regulated signal transduction histidine kinase (bacteriophytochrome)
LEPLRTISLFTDLLGKKARLDAESALMSQNISHALQRMSGLIEGIHSFVSCGQEPERGPVELDAVVFEALGDLHHAISSCDVQLTWDPLPVVYGNERLIGRVFQNLITNSIKHRGRLPVRIHISAEPTDTGFVIRVKDNGIGIDPRHHEFIFGLSKRLHGPELPGSGIGLAICKKIVEGSGGSLWVESSLGNGATFCFTIGNRRKSIGSALEAFEGERCGLHSRRRTVVA